MPPAGSSGSVFKPKSGIAQPGWRQRGGHNYRRIALTCGLDPARLTTYWLLLLFVAVTTLCVRIKSARDPGSLFFDPKLAYAPTYSAIRQQEAEQFVRAPPRSTAPRNGDSPPQLCVGIPSIARKDTGYLRTTMGSLLAGLSNKEREALRLVVFIPHTDPAIHPAFREPWLSNLADEILLYNLTKQELQYVQSLERDDWEHRTKGLYDYAYLLKACHAAGTPYIAIIEDDVVAMDGWFHRTLDGIREAAARSDPTGFLYLRMFYTEEFLGWNSEHWPTYSFWSVLAAASSACLVHWFRLKFPTVNAVLTSRLLLAIYFGLIPWAIVLVFAAGRVSVFPLPRGVNEMNDYGCCAQGLVFPREQASHLVQWYNSSRIGFADTLTERYADVHSQRRWALTPSVLQHIGAKSSKPDDFGHGAKYARSVAGTIWNFAFELNQADALREEHVMAANNPVAL